MATAERLSVGEGLWWLKVGEKQFSDSPLRFVTIPVEVTQNLLNVTDFIRVIEEKTVAVRVPMPTLRSGQFLNTGETIKWHQITRPSSSSTRN